MKKLVGILLLLAAIFILAACNTEAECEITFVVDDEVYDTLKTSGKEAISLPQNPIKEGYTFEGWYLDEGEWQNPFTVNLFLDAPLSGDTRVYAKWALNEHIHNLTHNAKIESTCQTDGAKDIGIARIAIRTMPMQMQQASLIRL